MDFQELERRFLEHVRDRIRRGEITERRLAHLAGISQPHVHNALRGKRAFSPAAADSILRVLRIDLRDFLRPDDEDLRH